MKKATKFIAILLAFTIIVCELISLPIVASAEATPTITVENAEGAVGDTVEVPFHMSNNPGIISMKLTVEFDTTALELIEVRDGGVLGGKTHKRELVSPYTLSWADDTAPENNTSNGTIVTLIFKIKVTAQAGKSYEIAPTYNNDYDEIFDLDLNTVDFDIVAGSVTVVAGAHEHSYDVNNPITVEPTCEKDGYVYAECTDPDCDEIKIMEVLPAGHDMFVSVKEPTCVEDGYRIKTCTRCNQTFENVFLPATEHKLEVVETVEATCTNAGRTTKKCTVCSEYVIFEVPALGHDEVVVAPIAPTCKESGYTAGVKCTRCSYTTVEEVAPLGHTPVEIPEVKNTCTEDGYTAGEKCSNCGLLLVKPEIIKAPGHSFEAGAYVPPTCTEPGSTPGGVCTVCGEVENPSDYIAPLGHKEVLNILVYPTCVQEGHAIVSCSECGVILLDEYLKPTQKHIGVAIKAIEPTCTNPGFTEGVACAVCNEILVAPEQIEPYNHVLVEVPGYEPTCTTEGRKNGEYCEICGIIVKEPTVIEALGHQVVIIDGVERTCTEPGLTVGAYCSVCDLILIEQEEMKPFGHVEIVIAATEPTCTMAGLTEGIACAECGFIIKAQALVPAYGHKIVVTPAVEPTCSSVGYTEGEKCANCGIYVKNPEVVLPLAHAAVVLEAIAPTCTEDGLSEGSMCDICGIVLVAQEIVKTPGHNYDRGVITTEPTETAPGVKTYTCRACGETKTEEVPMTPPEGAPVITVTGGRGKAGETVEVKIDIANNPGVVSMQLSVEYDESIMTLIEVRDGGILGESMHTPTLKAPYPLTWDNDLAAENITANGTIVTLVFKISEDAEECITSIKVSYSPDDGIFDVDLEAVDFYVVQGSVEVYDYILGDVNGDGKINTKDRAALARYLAHWPGYTADTINLDAADTNGDGKVNTKDRATLARYLAHWPGYETLSES